MVHNPEFALFAIPDISPDNINLKVGRGHGRGIYFPREAFFSSPLLHNVFLIETVVLFVFMLKFA